ncbi:MAG: hypothetical protein P1V51_04655 [Deltaproteobacteria bacterium]|nr:hypothetical protein [Deltaproteobacteria bacterium]
MITTRLLRVLLGLTLALPASMALGELSLGFSSGGAIVTAPEFELVSDGEGMPALGLRAGLELDPSFEVQLGLGYSGARAPLFGNQYAGLRLLTLELTAGYHLPLWSFLGTGVRLGILGDLGRLQIESYSDYDRFRGWSAGFGLVALAGLECRVPLESRRLDGARRPSGQTFRFGVEAGYRWRPAAMPFHDLDRKTAREDPEIQRIALEGFDAGSIRLSGAVVQLTAGMSF